MPSKPILDRQILAKFLPNHQAIVAFEKVLAQVDLTPTTIEEAAAQASLAITAANEAIGMVLAVAEALAQLQAMVAAATAPPDENYNPAPTLGTMANQNEDAVAITGGAVDGTPIGATTAAAGAFTALTSSTGFGCNGKTAQASMVLGAAATDLATVITLSNNIRAALIANGIGS